MRGKKSRYPSGKEGSKGQTVVKGRVLMEKKLRAGVCKATSLGFRIQPTGIGREES